jgi:hypothetical protein
MNQKLRDIGGFETRRVATEAAMREGILGLKFNTLRELRAEHAAPSAIGRRSLSPTYICCIGSENIASVQVPQLERGVPRR